MEASRGEQIRLELARMGYVRDLDGKYLIQVPLRKLEKKELESLDDKIAEMEQIVKNLEEELNKTTDYNQIKEICTKLDQGRLDLEKITERWMELNELQEQSQK